MPNPIRDGRSPLATPLRRVLTAVVLVALALCASGCLHAQVSLVVSDDDRVSGQIIAAIPKVGEEKGPQLVAPKQLGNKLRTDPYDQDGYVGTRIYMSDLTFSEAAKLTTLHAGSVDLLTLKFSRAGDAVRIDGRIDLTQLAKEGSDLSIKVAFPEKVDNYNGTLDDDNVVVWHPVPGEVTTMHAESRYSDSSSRGLMGWTAFMAFFALIAAAGVGALAYVYRNPRPAAVRRSGERPVNFKTEFEDLAVRIRNSDTFVAAKRWLSDRRNKRT